MCFFPCPYSLSTGQTAGVNHCAVEACLVGLEKGTQNSNGHVVRIRVSVLPPQKSVGKICQANNAGTNLLHVV